jgi:hypothetical protein
MTASKPSIGNLGLNSAATHAVTPTCSTAPNQSNNNYTSVLLRGYYGRRAQVQAQTPETALRHVAQTLVLDGYPDPFSPTDPKTSTC